MSKWKTGLIKHSVKRAINYLGFDVKRLHDRQWDLPVSSRTKALIRAMRPVATDKPLVRIGGAADGAYLIPDDFEGIAALFSPGIAEVSQFESEMAGYGMRCYLADASVPGPAEKNPAFTFDKKFLGLRSEGDYITLEDWVNRYERGDHDLMLQMDIEGAEWTVLSSISDRLLSRFRIMVVEFHSLSLLYDDYSEQIVVDVLQRLLRTHHVVHNHPNNAMWMNYRADVDIPEVIEVSFLRKDRSETLGPVTQYPHPLDIISNPLKPELILPAAWHG